MGAPRGGDFDVVVIGAGLGGLSAGACLARAGRRVLVVERQDGPGGNDARSAVGRTRSTRPFT